MSANRIAIMLLDDHPAVLHGLRLALNTGMFEVVGAYTRIPDLFAGLEHYAREHQRPVDVALLDYNLGMDAADGISLIQRMRHRAPATRVIAMTALEQDSIKTLIISAGAHGYIGKSVGTEAIPGHIFTVMRNKVVIDPPMRPAEHAVASTSGVTPGGLASLTQRETEVLRCLVAGLTTGQIAAKFNRTSSTISTQIGSLFRKLGIASVSELHSQRDVWGELLAERDTPQNAKPPAR